MVSKLPWAQKRMFWVFEKSIFQFFADFWLTKLKPFSGRERQSVKIYSNQNLAMITFLENGLEASLSSKINVLTLSKEHFSVFAHFWVTKLKPFSGKVRQRIQDCLNQNLVKGSFLEKGLEASLISKMNVLSAWKGHFLVFCTFLSDEIENIFWENET